MSQLQHVVCTACDKGILTVISEVGIEAEGCRRSFNHSQQLTGRIYKCDVCGKSFVKVGNEFLELRY